MAVRLHTKIGVVPDDDRLASSPDAVLVHEPAIGATFRSKGGLYAVVTAREGDGRMHDATSFVAEEIDRQYYYDESAGIAICLEKAIRAAGKRLGHRRDAHSLAEGSVGVVVAVIRERELYVATAGQGDAFLARQGRFLTLPAVDRGQGLPTEGELHVDVWRGEFLVGDTLVLSSPEMAKRLGTEELRRSITSLHPDSAARHLHHQLVAEGGATSDAILVIEATEVPATRIERTLVPVKPAEPLAGAPDTSPIPLADTVAAGANAARGGAQRVGAAGASAVTGLVGSMLGVLPRRSAAYRRVTPRAARWSAQQRAATGLLGVLGIVLLAGLAIWVLSGGLGGDSRRITTANQGEAALADARSQIDQVFGGGADLVAGDPQRALTLLRGAWAKLDEAEKNGVLAGELTPLRDQVTAGLDRLYMVVRTNSTIVATLRTLSPKADLADLVRGPDGAAYTIDRSTHAVIRIDVAKKTALVVVRQGDGGGNGVGDPWILAVGGPDLVIVDHNDAVWRWRPSDKAGHGTLAQLQVRGKVTWGNDIRDVGTYVRNFDAGLYNLYVVDPSSKQILRYAPAADGSGYPSDPTGYLATASDVSGYEQLFIDGDIYALESGTVIRLVNGRPDDFAPAVPPDDADLRPGHSYALMTASAAQRAGRLYVYDSMHARILAFDKEIGGLVEQYIAADGQPPFTDVRGMYLVEGATGKPSTLVWAGPDRLYTTVLRPAPAPGSQASPAPSASPRASGTTRPSGTARPRATARSTSRPSPAP